VVLQKLGVPAVAAILGLMACGGSSGPTSFTVRGTVDFRGAGGWTKSTGTCDYSDGTSVGPVPLQLTISNGSKVVASTTVQSGTLAGSADCMLRFKFTGVPTGAATYGISAGSAGTTWVTAGNIRKPVSLTLTQG
jgi:hypothetical protein